MNKIAIVTGANSGMGKATTLALMNQGFHVIMACRSQERGNAALEEILSKHSGGSVQLLLCDLASFKSIEAFVSVFKKEHQQLDVLVNNAGVILTKRMETEQGFEKQFGVNHIGHFYLTQLLMDVLLKSAPSRIINVSSGAHKAGHIKFNDLPMIKRYGTFKAYSRSKLANVLFTRELANKLNNTGVTVNCCHPGAVATNMGINRETGFGKSLMKFLSIFFLTPEQGADTAIYLAISEDVKDISGQYFYKRKIASISKAAQSKISAKELWKVTESLVKNGQNNIKDI